MKGKLMIVEIAQLKEHEAIIEEHLEEIKAWLLKEGVQIDPIIVATDYMIILDGHHRVRALKELGYSKVLAYLVDYHDEEIEVRSWQGEDVRFTKEEVIQRALNGEKLPPKSTRHILPYRPSNINIPLEELR